MTGEHEAPSSDTTNSRSQLLNKEDDTLEDLHTKLEKLKAVEEELQSEFVLLTAKEKQLENEKEGWECPECKEIRFPYPTLTAVLSASSRFVAVVFEKSGDNKENALIVLFQVKEGTAEYPSGLQFCASLPVKLNNKEGLCLDQCLCLHEGSLSTDSPSLNPDLSRSAAQLILTTVFRSELSGAQSTSSAVKIIEWTGSELRLAHELKTEVFSVFSCFLQSQLDDCGLQKPMVCLLQQGSNLFLGGKGGRVEEWKWSQTTNPQWCKYSLPKARLAPDGRLRQLCLLMKQNTASKAEQRLIGLSAEGAIFLWDPTLRTLLATFHPTSIRIHQMCPVDLVPSQMRGETWDVGLMVVLTKLHDMHENTSLTPLILNSQSLRLGTAFPLTNAQFVKAVDGYGLAVSREGKIRLWNQTEVLPVCSDTHHSLDGQGTTLWSIQTEMLTSVMFDPVSRSIWATTQQASVRQWQLMDRHRQ